MDRRTGVRLPMRYWRTACGVLASVALALVISACHAGGQNANYFPLDSGWSWQYRVTLDIKNVGKETTAIVVANSSPLTESNQKVFPRIYQDGHRYDYISQEDGILLVSDRVSGNQVRPAEAKQYVIKYPLAAGTSWPVASRTYLLRRQIFSPTAVIMVPITVPIEVTYTIEATDDVVRVPAGVFRNCLRIRGTAASVRDLGERIGDAEVRVDATEWFAPGVGLVKMVRKEDSRPESPASGSMAIELQRLDKGSWFN